MSKERDGGEIYRAILSVSIALGTANAGGRMTIVLPSEGFDLLAVYLAEMIAPDASPGSVIVMDLPTGAVHVTRAT